MVNQVWGVYVGVIADVNDPELRGRARLRIPQVTGMGVTGWSDPASAGAVAVGDQVAVTFTGGDPNWPQFWPQPAKSQLGWQPLVMATGWRRHPDPRYGAPSARITGDGMIELDGAFTQTDPPATLTAGTKTVATLPYGWQTRFDSYAVSASTTSLESVLGTYMRVGVVDGDVVIRLIAAPSAGTPVSVFMSGLRYRKL